MKVEENKKLHMRYLSIEVGTKCNLKCRHCYLGDPPDLTIKPEYIDAVIENAYEIDEIWISGGEITFYLEQIELILQKLIAAKIKVNYVGFVTNGVVKSEQLVSLFENFRHITIFPNDANLRISIDEFHSEQSGKTEKDMEEVMKWYSDRVGGKVIANKVDNATLFLMGRAKKISNDSLKRYKNVVLEEKIKCETSKISFKPLCDSKENACGYGCVRNCFTSSIYLAADGYLYTSCNRSYDSDDRSDFALCHILDSTIFDAMKKWNADCEKGNGMSIVKIKEDSEDFYFFIMKAAIAYFKLNLAEAYEENDIKKMEECATVMDYCVEKWNNYLTNNSIKECIQTVIVRESTKSLLAVYKYAYIDVINPFMKDKKMKADILASLREEREINEIRRNIFISYATKDLDNYIKYYEQVVQWKEKNSEQE